MVVILRYLPRTLQYSANSESAETTNKIGAVTSFAVENLVSFSPLSSPPVGEESEGEGVRHLTLSASSFKMKE
jgi:hypothetical protein